MELSDESLTLNFFALPGTNATGRQSRFACLKSRKTVACAMRPKPMTAYRITFLRAGAAA
jgi:hypothetical protein